MKSLTMFLRVMVFATSVFCSSYASADCPPGTPPGTQCVDMVNVTAQTLEDLQGLVSWIQPLWDFLGWFQPETADVKDRCGSGTDTANTPSTASSEARNAAANEVIQNKYQGLGGNGRPFSAKVLVTFADGGTELYLFSGMSGNVAAVPGTLKIGTSPVNVC